MPSTTASNYNDSVEPVALQAARQIVRDEASALTRMAACLDVSFCDAVDQIVNCSGNVITLGIGKAGLVAQKIAATFCSTGTRSFFLHPSEALHGDLGRVSAGDVALVLSYSGQTHEIVCLVPLLKQLQAMVIGMTGQPQNDLGQSADITLSIGQVNEAGRLGLAPTCSTTAMMAMGDALALVASEARDFRAEDFARFHPGGSLGRALSPVSEVMRPLDRCRVGNENHTVRDVLVQVGQPGRRTGAVILTDDHGKLTGLFTDSDLARLFEHHRDHCLDEPIRQVMTVSPTTIDGDALLGQAVQRLAQRRISELPVVDRLGRPQGLIDITDVVAMLPADPQARDTSPNKIDRLAVTESATEPTTDLESIVAPTILPFPTNPRRSP